MVKSDKLTIYELEQLAEKIYNDIDKDLAATTLKNVVLINDKKKLIEHLKRMYVVGFENGSEWERSKHGNGLEKKVKQLDQNKKVVKVWDSINDAWRHFGGSKSAIRTAIRKKQRSSGFYWELVDDKKS
jgi:hypothetical protein